MSHFVDGAGRYRADSLIATGGMGEVWKGWDTTLDRAIALKVLRREYAGDSIFRARFEAEARHAGSLSAPGIAAIWDVGQSLDEDGVPRPFLVMELVDGQPLSALIRHGEPMDPDVVRHLVAQTGDALAVAHRAGIVHRDVKPANILVTADRQVKITDFGIARALSAMALTGTGAVMGTPQYLSPEQARGDAASPASDVYGLGVVAYECLSGARPFDKETAVATALAHLNDDVPPLPASVPADLAAVVMRALTKRPAERYQDGAAFAAAIRAADGTGPVPVVPAATTTTVSTHPVAPVLVSNPATQVLAPVPGPGTLPAAEEESDRWPLWAIIATVAVVVLIGLIGWLVLRNNAPEPVITPRPSSQPSSASANTSPSTSPTATPSTFSLDPASYVGADIDSVLADLRGLELRPTSHQVPNPGDQTPNTVVAIEPNSNLSAGDTVDVAFYGPLPTPTPTPTTPAPTETPEPTETPTTPTSTATPSGETSSPAARKETR